MGGGLSPPPRVPTPMLSIQQAMLIKYATSGKLFKNMYTTSGKLFKYAKIGKLFMYATSGKRIQVCNK